MAELQRVNLRIRPDMHEWYKKRAEISGISMNATFIIALETYMQQQQMAPLLPDMLAELKRQMERAEKRK